MAGKNKKYKPLKNVLSIDTALVQASSLLDIAAVQAVADGDINGMKKIARSWLEVSAVIHQLSGGGEEEMEQSEVLSETTIGFRANPPVDEDEEEEYDEEEPEFKIGFRSNR